MQWDRTAGAGEVSGSVRGLGVSDVLRLELLPVQRPALARQLAELATAIHARIDGLRPPAHGHDEAAVDALERTRYELQLARMMHARLEASGGDGPFAFVGPSGLVLELVRGCCGAAVGALAALIAREPGEPVEPGALEQAAAVAAAWLRTLLDCRAVAGFRFDPGVDAWGFF